MKTKLAAILCLIAMGMVLPVVAGVNTLSVNNHTVRADGSGLPVPPTLPGHFMDGSGLPVPPTGPGHFADGSGLPVPPTLPGHFMDGSGLPVPPTLPPPHIVG